MFIRWQNCVAFSDEETFFKETEMRNGEYYFNRSIIDVPNTFPAFYQLNYPWYDYWKPIDKNTMIKKFENAIQEYQNLLNDLKNL
jgi:hypothetical protein